MGRSETSVEAKSVEVRVLICGGCGGPIKSGAKACAYCDSGLDWGEQTSVQDQDSEAEKQARVTKVKEYVKDGVQGLKFNKGEHKIGDNSKCPYLRAEVVRIGESSEVGKVVARELFFGGDLVLGAVIAEEMYIRYILIKNVSINVAYVHHGNVWDDFNAGLVVVHHEGDLVIGSNSYINCLVVGDGVSLELGDDVSIGCLIQTSDGPDINAGNSLDVGEYLEIASENVPMLMDDILNLPIKKGERQLEVGKLIQKVISDSSGL